MIVGMGQWSNGKHFFVFDCYEGPGPMVRVCWTPRPSEWVTVRKMLSALSN